MEKCCSTGRSPQRAVAPTEEVHRSSCKVPVILVRFYWNLNLVERFSENDHTPNFMEIRPEGEELFHADRRTQMTKLVVGFRNSAKEPEDRP